jgi:hypothetical protein
VNGNGQIPKAYLARWQRRIFKPSYTGNDLKFTSPDWCVELQHHGRRAKLSLETPNKEAAAARAKDIYIFLHANGWKAMLTEYRPPRGMTAHNLERINKRFELLREKLSNHPANRKLSKRFWEIVRGIGCTACGFSTWPGILQFHHIDKNRGDDSLTNLTILCPNCHRALHQKIASISYRSLAELLGEEEPPDQKAELLRREREEISQPTRPLKIPKEQTSPQ